MSSRTWSTMQSIDQGYRNDNAKNGGFLPAYSLLILSIYLITLAIIGYLRKNADPEDNYFVGYVSLVILLLIFGVLVIPDGPFTRPHPVFWRLVFAISIVYLLTLILVLFQNHETIKHIIYRFYPDLRNVTDVFQTPYDMNCADYRIKNVLSKTDIYTLGHLIGWIGKAWLLRDYGMCWLLSITWEVTELAFAHLLPFSECWWDSIVLDLLITNGSGILIGMLTLKMFELETFEWLNINDKQFTNKDISQNTMLTFSIGDICNRCNCLIIFVRIMAIFVFITFWQITMLNTFFQMQIFDIPPGHQLVQARFIYQIFIVAPTTLQYIEYINQDQISRLGSWCWLFCSTVIIEALINMKYEPNILAHLQIGTIFLWLIIQIFFCITFVVACNTWSKYRTKTIAPNKIQSERVHL